MFVEDVLLDPAQLATVSEQFFSEQEGEGVAVVCSLEGEHDVDVVCLSEVPYLTANILGSFAFCLLAGENG